MLIKPQFEASPAQVEKGGLVKKPEVIAKILLSVCDQITALGWTLRAMAKAAVKGADGNQEYVLWLSIDSSIAR